MAGTTFVSARAVAKLEARDFVFGCVCLAGVVATFRFVEELWFAWLHGRTI